MQMSHTPTAPGKFLHLRYLSITFAGWRFSRAYDYFSLVSFLDASPLLETFILCVSYYSFCKAYLVTVPFIIYWHIIIGFHLQILQKGKHDLTLRDPIYPRQMSERQHDSLKNVKINGFSSTKSLVELTCHILQNTTSLECLTLDTTRIEFRCSDSSVDVCLPSDRDAIKGAHKALLAIRTYIEGIVPATVKFSVLEPCRRCYAW